MNRLNKHVFEVEDFIENSQWVLNSPVNSETVDFTLTKENGYEFIVRDRQAIFSSPFQSAKSYDNKGNELEEEEFYYAINKQSLSNLIKVIPKNAESITMNELFNENQELYALEIECKNVKTNIPCVKTRKRKGFKELVIGEVGFEEFFKVFESSRNATSLSRTTDNELACIDLKFVYNDNNPYIRVFGTDSFIMVRTSIHIEGYDNDSFKDKIDGKRFLLSSFSTNLKNAYSLNKGTEKIKLITNDSSKSNLFGIVFENGSKCIFSCLDFKPIGAEEAIFNSSKKSINFSIDFRTTEIKDLFRKIILLGNESDSSKMIISPDNIRLTDENEVSSLDCKKETKQLKEDELDIQVLSFSDFVVKKFLSCINSKECELMFSSRDSRTIFIKFNIENNASENISDTEMVVALKS